MTVGIYKLSFKGTDRVYIGQSREVERRYTTHLNELRKGFHNRKLQEAYNTYGKPSMEIVLECSIAELNEAEKEAIAIYDSMDNGFNMLEGGDAFPVLCGEKNSRSLYTDEEIEWIFNYLVDNLSMSLNEASSNTGVHRSTLKNINNGYSHKWLKDKYPDKYEVLMNNKRAKLVNTLIYSGKPIPIAISPEGEEFEVHSITSFAKEHNLNRGALGDMLRGNARQHKGWYSGGYK